MQCKLLFCILALLQAGHCRFRVPNHRNHSRNCSSGPESNDEAHDEAHDDEGMQLLIAVVVVSALVLLCAGLVICLLCCNTRNGTTNFLPAPETEAERARAIAERLSVRQSRETERKSCRKGHGLMFVQPSRPAKQQPTCHSCGQRYDPLQGCWECQECKFGICVACKNVVSQGALRYPSCKSGHALVLSKYRSDSYGQPYYNGRYQCAVCFLVQDCSDGRYFCPFCLIDVCRNCQAPPALAEPLNPELFQASPPLECPALSSAPVPALASAAVSAPDTKTTPEQHREPNVATMLTTAPRC